MDDGDIRQVRRFNRLVTRQAGALEASYLKLGRPLGEARLLFEIGVEGADLRHLRHRLGLDSGYLSRLLRSLESQGLTQVGRDPEDGRRRLARLTAEGRRAYGRLESASDAHAAAMLAPIGPEQRRRLLDAMETVERVLRAAAVEIDVEPIGSRDARACLSVYFAEIAERFEDGFDPGQGEAAKDREMEAPHGVFLLARLDGAPVGCGGLKFGDRRTGEIKRMWIARSARGLGLGRRLLRALEQAGRETGLETIRLDTNRALTEALALYRSEGYRETERYNDNPYAHAWLAKPL